jgi:ligand-binding sensor domain-containing protein/signal transduction histidine kinase
MWNVRAVFLAVGLLLLCARVSSAALTGLGLPAIHIDPHIVQLPLFDKADRRFTRILPDGLSQTRVTNIVQDGHGFMWFGTQYGLNRFDGYNFKVFMHEADNPNSLSGSYIYSLFKDRSGALWIGCFNALDRIDPSTEKVTHYKGDPANVGTPKFTVTHISEDTGGTLWLSTSKGLYSLDPKTGHTERFTHDADEPFSLSSSDIRSTGQDSRGTLWVATGAGLDAFDPITRRITEHIPLHEGRDFSFFEDSRKTFWLLFASGNGLAVYDRDTHHLTRYSFSTATRPANGLTGVIAMLEDHAGELWLGTLADGVLHYDRANKQFIRYHNRSEDRESIAEDRVTTLREDAEGNIWVGLGTTAPTFFQSQKAVFSRLPALTDIPATLGESLVNVIYEDRQGALWTGMTGALIRWDRETGRHETYELPGNGISSDILAVIEDRRGHLWVGTSGQGAYMLDPLHGGIIQSFHHDPSDPSSLSNDTAWRFLIDHSGTLWITTLDGLNRYDSATKRFQTYRDGLNGISSHQLIIEDAHNLLWLSTIYGIVTFDPSTTRFSPVSIQDGIAVTSGDRPNSLFIARSGSIWIATQNGLMQLNSATGSVPTYRERDGLPSNAVSCILEDDNGFLWMSTSRGISRFDVQNKHFQNFSIADGLPGGDLTGWGACARMRDGELYFGGFAGAVFFDPHKIVEGSYVPPVALTDLQVAGLSSSNTAELLLRAGGDKSRGITLTHAQDKFSIGFAALSFRFPSTNRYRFKLVGFDDDWRETKSDQRLVSYTALSAGSYTFLVQGATSRSAWSDPGASLRIKILPAWWQTWWFRTLMLTATIIVAALLYRVRVAQLAFQFQMRLDERISERTRIARDLHDSLLQGFQGLMYRLQAVRDLLPGRPETAMKALDVAMSGGDDAMTEGREAVQDLRSTPSFDRDLGQTISLLGKELLPSPHGKDVRLNLMVEGKSRLLDETVHDEVYRIAREALRNSFQHSSAKNIESEISYGEETFSLRIRDDGIGIGDRILDQGQRPGHWGLPGMRERATALGGKLVVWSKPGAGTEIELIIPSEAAYGRQTAKSRFSFARFRIKKSKPD